MRPKKYAVNKIHTCTSNKFSGGKYDSSITIGTANIQTRTFVYLETKIKVNVKIDLTLEHATKAQRWSRGIALHFF